MATEFITIQDYKYKLRDTRRQMIVEGEDNTLEDAEETAIATVRDALFSRYDVDAIFSSTGNDRPKNVLRWVINLAVYYIHERIPDKLVPERVKKNYDDTLFMLEEIADGKKSVDLPQLSNTEGETVTKFRWGSNKPRTN